MRRALLLATLALAGCDQTGADGYAFGKKEFTHPAPVVMVVVHPSLAGLRAKAPASVEGDREHLMAWSVLRGGVGGACEVHVIDPKVSYQPEWIGHEFAHCVWGRWHR